MSRTRPHQSSAILVAVIAFTGVGILQLSTDSNSDDQRTLRAGAVVEGRPSVHREPKPRPVTARSKVSSTTTTTLVVHLPTTSTPTTTTTIRVVTLPPSDSTTIPVTTLPSSTSTTPIVTVLPTTTVPTPIVTVLPTTTVPTTVAASTTTVAPQRPLKSLTLVESSQPPAGFAEQQGLRGGIGGQSYVVTTNADSGPGTYRDALSQGNRYVTFAPQMAGTTIRLASEVTSSASHLTIDGSGIDVTVTGYATKFEGTDVVVAGMRYRNMTGSANEDAITFRNPNRAQLFGVFGNEFETASDGLLDIIWNNGNDVFGTVCGNKFSRHDKAMLVHSGTPEREGGTYNITMCQNWWYDVYQRAPFSRDALVHQFNDVFEAYGSPDGAGGGSKSGFDLRRSQHLVEGSVAIPRRIGTVTWTGATVTKPRAEFAGTQLSGSGAIRVIGSMHLNNPDVTATEVQIDPGQVFTPPYAARAEAADHALRDGVVANAGKCLPRSDASQVNPCRAIQFVDPAQSITVVVDGDAIKVVGRIGDNVASLARGTDGRWSVGASALFSSARSGWLEVTATGADGTTLTTDRTMVVLRP